jgi:hypothetical protein
MVLLFDLNNTSDDEADESDESDESVLDDKDGDTNNLIAPKLAAVTSSSGPEDKEKDNKKQETSIKEEEDVEDDGDEEEEELQLVRKVPKPKLVQKTAEGTASASIDPKSNDVKMAGKFSRYSKWERQKKETFVPCTLFMGCILKGGHADICFCPIVDYSNKRKCRPITFAPPKRAKRANQHTMSDAKD